MHRHHQVGMVYIWSSQYLLILSLPRYNNKTYRIDGLGWDKNPMTEFEKKTGDKLLPPLRVAGEGRACGPPG